MTNIPDSPPDYDYKTTLGDRFLDVVKSVISNAETRHHFLGSYARGRAMLPWHYHPAPELTKTIRFHDRSLPLTVASPIFLAAGGNKTAESLPAFAELGFGGVTTGSATLDKWNGNPHRPRVNLLPLDHAMQNSMGLNNPGIERIAKEVDRSLGRCHKRKMALGISVADTPGVTDEDQIFTELEATFRRGHGAADYIELNLSCPNTGTARLDTNIELLGRLLNHVMDIRKTLAPRKAVFVKLSPDMGMKSLEATLQTVADSGVTGLVLFNTFPGDRSRFLHMLTPQEKFLPLTESGALGGVSGRVLYQNTLPAVRFIRKQLPHMAIFATGGIDHGAKVLDLLEAGADAVQVYTVLAYRWNAVIKMNKELSLAMKDREIATLDGYAPWRN